MARRAEDMVRRMAGMPSRKEEQRRRKRQEKERRNRTSNTDNYGSRRYRDDDEEDGVVSMRHYAEDVEYSETKELSETTIVEDGGDGKRRVYRENQVSDAEYVEIKDK